MNKIMSKCKQNKGITTADLAVAIVILMIFVSLVATAFYNYYSIITEKNRTAIATNSAVDVIEQVKKLDYEQISQESVMKVIEDLKIGIQANTGNTISIPEPYEVTAMVETYNETEGNMEKKDLIKKVTITVGYSVGDKKESIQFSKLITK